MADGHSGGSAKSCPQDSHSLQWSRLGAGCPEHRCGGQGAAEGSAAPSGSTASSPSAVPAGSGMGLVLLCSPFLSPQLKHSELSSTERHWTMQVQRRDTNTKAVIKGWSTGCTRGEQAKEAPSCSKVRAALQRAAQWEERSLQTPASTGRS